MRAGRVWAALLVKGRLRAVMALVPGCRVAADVATGDGRLAVALVRSARARRVIATDRTPGPLAAASRQVLAAGLQEAIELRLGDGLEVLHPGEAEVIVIAGLGGETMAGILERGEDIARASRRLVLQPLKDASRVRRWLRRRDMGTVSEDLVQEAGRYYHVMAAEPEGPEPVWIRELGELNDELGGWLITRAHPLLPGLLAQKLGECRQVLGSLERAGTVSRRRRWELRQARLEEAERCWQRSRQS